MKSLHLLVLVYTLIHQAVVTSQESNSTLSNQLPQATTKPIHHTNVIPGVAGRPKEASQPHDQTQTSNTTGNRTDSGSSTDPESVSDDDESLDRERRKPDHNETTVSPSGLEGDDVRTEYAAGSNTEATTTAAAAAAAPTVRPSLTPASKALNSGPGTQSGSETVHTEMSINLDDSDEDKLVISWSFQSNDIRITQFEVNYKMNDEEEEHHMRVGLQVREFSLHNLHMDQDYFICVQALNDNATVIQQVCKDWSETSFKYLTGILAGVVFLVPVLSTLVWILVKDRRVRRKYGAWFNPEKDQQEFEALVKEPTLEVEKKDSFVHPVLPDGYSYVKPSLQAGVTLEAPAPSKPQSRYQVVPGQDGTLTSPGQLAVITNCDHLPSPAGQTDNSGGQDDTTDHMVVHF